MQPPSSGRMSTGYGGKDEPTGVTRPPSLFVYCSSPPVPERMDAKVGGGKLGDGQVSSPSPSVPETGWARSQYKNIPAIDLSWKESSGEFTSPESMDKKKEDDAQRSQQK
jgi:hypothetical protein